MKYVKNSIYINIIGLLLLLLTMNACSDKMTGRVTRVMDGDTIEINRKNEIYIVRLDGIDCPESNQKYGDIATQYVYDVCYGKTVEMIISGKDRYGRHIAAIILPGGKELNAELLRLGLAWHYKEYNNDQHYADLENAARKAKIGLWADPDPIPPWDFRRGIGSVPEDLEGKYVGSNNSTIYHKPGCMSAQKIKEGNLIVFETKTEAESNNYVACRICKP